MELAIFTFLTFVALAGNPRLIGRVGNWHFKMRNKSNSDSLSESIWFPKKIGTSDSIVLVVGVCLPNHRSTDYSSWHGSGAPYFARLHAVHGPQPGRPFPPTVPPPGRVGESNQTPENRFESNRHYFLVNRNALVPIPTSLLQIPKNTANTDKITELSIFPTSAYFTSNYLRLCCVRFRYLKYFSPQCHVIDYTQLCILFLFSHCSPWVRL